MMQDIELEEWPAARMARAGKDVAIITERASVLSR